MKFHCDTGIFNLSDNLTLSPKMRKKDISVGSSLKMLSGRLGFNLETG